VRIMEIDVDDVPWKDDLVDHPPVIEAGRPPHLSRLGADPTGGSPSTSGSRPPARLLRRRHVPPLSLTTNGNSAGSPGPRVLRLRLPRRRGSGPLSRASRNSGGGGRRGHPPLPGARRRGPRRLPTNYRSGPATHRS
jgi:hypothetical protein